MRTPTLEWGKAPGKTTGLIGQKWKHRKVLELTGTNRPRTYHKHVWSDPADAGPPPMLLASTVRFWNNNQLSLSFIRQGRAMWG